MSDANIRWIFQTRYELKQYCIRKSQWRKKAGIEWIKEKRGTAEEFIKLWKKLKIGG